MLEPGSIVCIKNTGAVGTVISKHRANLTSLQSSVHTAHLVVSAQLVFYVLCGLRLLGPLYGHELVVLAEQDNDLPL